MSQKGISIILPVYKTELYLERCINSLLKQTMDDVEILIIDDASPDKSDVLIRKHYLGKNFRQAIKYIRHRYNRGLGVARNTGLQNAQGKYVVFIDSDDWLEEDCLQQLWQAAEESQTEIVAAGAILSYPNGEEKKLNCEQLLKAGGIDLWNNLNIGFMKHVVWNKIYRRDFIERYALRFHPLNMGEDSLFNFEATVLCEKYRIIPGALYHYYQSSQSNFRGKISIKQIGQLFQMESIINKLKERLDFYKGLQIDSDVLFQYFFSLNFDSCMKRFYGEHGLEKGNKVLKDLWKKEFGEKYCYINYFFKQYVNGRYKFEQE